MPNFFKKIFRQVVQKPIQYASKTGSTQISQTGRSVSGGQIISVNGSLKINSTKQIQKASYQIHLRNMGLNQSAIQAFKPLQWATLGARQKLQFSHKINQTTLHKIAVAVRRVSNDQIVVSVISYQCKVLVNPPKTIIHKVKRHYGPGWRNSDNFTEGIDRGLNNVQLERVMIALKNQASKYDAQGLALSNV